jgi:FtsZ-binding cell division protein ZapB
MRARSRQISLLNEIKVKHESEISALKEEHKNIINSMENDYRNNLNSLRERNDRLKSSSKNVKDLINAMDTAEDLNECYVNNTIPKSIQKILKDSE